MIELRVPREDVNDDTATVARWLVPAGAPVVAGQVVCELETTKTIFEVCAPAGGHLHPVAPEKAELAVGALLARITDSADPPAVQESPVETATDPGAFRATRQAEEFARAHGIDLAPLAHRGILTLKEVQAAAGLLKPHWRTPPGVRRVLVLGAGVAAMQVLDILLHDREVLPVGCLDDHASLHGVQLFGVPVLGGLDRLDELWRDRVFDAAIVGIGTNVPVRAAMYGRLQDSGIPLVNAIDPSARINRQALLGQGLVLCAFVHVGVAATLGDNCFLAAHSSVDHHCSLGRHVVMGPGCLLSGTVTVGDGTLFGSGVIVQPGLKVGARCRVASGSVILRDIPSEHAVKMRPPTEIVMVKSGG